MYLVKQNLILNIKGEKNQKNKIVINNSKDKLNPIEKKENIFNDYYLIN